MYVFNLICWALYYDIISKNWAMTEEGMLNLNNRISIHSVLVLDMQTRVFHLVDAKTHPQRGKLQVKIAHRSFYSLNLNG